MCCIPCDVTRCCLVDHSLLMMHSVRCIPCDVTRCCLVDHSLLMMHSVCCIPCDVTRCCLVDHSLLMMHSVCCVPCDVTRCCVFNGTERPSGNGLRIQYDHVEGTVSPSTAFITLSSTAASSLVRAIDGVTSVTYFCDVSDLNCALG